MVVVDVRAQGTTPTLTCDEKLSELNEPAFIARRMFNQMRP
jgi:hypothetical protein